MLGNIKPFMPALSEEEKNRYNAFYCGLCRALGKDYGIFSRFMLNYDMTFVAIVHDTLNNESFVSQHCGCFANPFKKKDILIPTAGTRMAADVLIMLAYFKLLDNIYDENFLKKAGCMIIYPYFYVKYRKAARKHPVLASVLSAESRNQQAYEKNCTDLDQLAMPTANMVKNILLSCSCDNDKSALAQFGFFLGRVIYLTDALEDMERDEKDNKFNIFNIKKVSRDSAREECFMALGEMAYWYKQLDFKDNKGIADNIIYLSLARKIKFAGEENGEKNG